MAAALVLAYQSAVGCGSRGVATEGVHSSPPAAVATRAPDRPGVSFDGRTPPPDLVSTGDDFGAIWRSFEAYIAWLYGHRPDPALVDEVIAPGTDVHRRYVSDLTILSRFDQRFVDRRSIRSVRTVWRSTAVATLVVEYAMSGSRVYDRDGAVVDELVPPETDGSFAVTLSADSSGRWRVGEARRHTENPEVNL